MIFKAFSKNKLILFSGLLFFAIHLQFSSIFFKERMLNEDAPFYLMQLIQHGKMLCEHYRYSVFLFNWVPLLALKAGASIEAITWVYSIAIDAFYLVLFLYAFFVLKNAWGAFMLVVFLGIALGRDYFVPGSEYPLAIISTLVLVGMEFNNSSLIDRNKLIWSAVIILISLNFHPIAILALGYIICYEFLVSDKHGKKHWVVLGGIAILIFLVRTWLVPFDEYEDNKMKSWSEVFNFILKPSNLPAAFAAIKYHTDYSLELIGAYLLSIILLVLQKRWLVLLFSCCFTYFLFILFSVIKSPDDTNLRFAEYFILVGIPALMPIIKHPGLLKGHWFRSATIIAIALSTFIFRTCTNVDYFKHRINYVERLIKNGASLKEKRYIIDYRNIPYSYISNNWPITFQTLLLSSFRNPDSAVTYIATKDINAYDTLIRDKSFFLGPEWRIEMYNIGTNRIKKHYFNLPEEGYRKITTSQKDFIGDSASFNASTVRIILLDSVVRKINDSLSFVIVKIVNNSGKVIPSIPDSENATFLTYHLVDPSSNAFISDNLRTTLETDIYKENLQALYINTKLIRHKKIELELDFVTENLRWWGIKTRGSVKIY
ncbi:MAG: hypothetical protein M3Q95_11905 [Bacteroidota bacterium]|nr:hypothetical protein [Nitrosopumilus sp.]MDQ3051583.1 hypothetical protein [Bacteroidota bacterium]